MEYVVFFIVVLAALFVSGLFVWGIFELFRQPARHRKVRSERKKHLVLKRHVENPILQPGKYDFEREAVMNPAAVQDGDQTHLFYRAIGADGVSRIGYANSKDGIHIDERLPYPVYMHRNLEPREDRLRKYSLAYYGSGGSWSGSEDPRAVLIDDRIYMTYNLFNGWDSMRVAVTSTSRDDVNAKRWNFTSPNFLSARGDRQKNWMFFPEKIHGKFALFHSLYHDDKNRVKIEYLDDPLTYDAETARFASDDPQQQPDRPIAWHVHMRSLSAPPVKTALGWLGFYHAMDRLNYNRYKVGALLLDKDDPTKVIARAQVPVLEPEARYELGGAKPGIVYVSGATVHGDDLTVYYGAADNYVCAARTSLSDFVMRLFEHKPARLAPVPLFPSLSS